MSRVLLLALFLLTSCSESGVTVLDWRTAEMHCAGHGGLKEVSETCYFDDFTKAISHRRGIISATCNSGMTIDFPCCKGEGKDHCTPTLTNPER